MNIAEQGAAFLEHYGVKGMKWGVRKSPEAKAAKAAKKVAKADAKFEKNAATINTYIAIHNKSADHFNAHIGEINKRYDLDLNDQKNVEIARKYDAEVSVLARQSYEKAASSITNASGTRSYQVTWDRDGNIMIGTKEVQQADSQVKFIVTRDATGHVVSIVPDSMAQSDEFVGEFLEHYGVKGMKWGKRKDAPAPGTVRVTDKKKKLKAEGGKGFETHPDAVKAATSKQKAKASGVKTLSNQELRDLATRLNLEKQVRELSVADKQANANPATKFIKKLLVNSGKQEAQKVGNEAASQGVSKLMSAAKAQSKKNTTMRV